MYIYTSKQEVFDKVSAWLLRDGGSPAYDKMGCAYLANDGNMCAVGVLMQECDMALRKVYGDVSDLFYTAYQMGLKLPFGGEVDGDFLGRFQEIHDDFNGNFDSGPEPKWNRSNMIQGLKRIAEDYNLVLSNIFNKGMDHDSIASH